MFVRVLLTVSLLHITTVSGLVCLYCSDAVAPADCDTVIKCGSHESCYVDAYVSATGSIRYNLGCRDSSQCSGPSHLGKRELNHVVPSQQLTNKLYSETDDELYQISNGSLSNIKSLLLNEIAQDVPSARASGFLVCSECCTANLCSNAGCGNKGYISPRGPICYQCAEQISQDDCSKIRLCGRDEVCLLQKTLNPITHEVRYTTRCEGEQRCLGEILRYERLASVLVGKRQKSSKRESLEIGGSCIVQCCKTDMCNVDCNGTSSSSSSSWVPGSITPTLATKTVVPYPTTVSAHKTKPTTTMINMPIPTTKITFRTPQPVRITSIYATPPPPTTKGSWVHFTPSPLSMTTTLSSTNSGGCWYKNVIHREGEHWNDDCDLDCTCMDSRTGLYYCKPLCVHWNLPPYCKLYPPPPGKCCSVPVCSGGITIQYPSGYSQQ